MDTGTNDRGYWVDLLNRLQRPVLTALARRELHKVMPVEEVPGHNTPRREVTYLEAFGRLICGVAPWLELTSLGGEEGRLRAEIAAAAREGMRAATDPGSPDFMNFTRGGQPVVDAAFLAHGILRAPNELWHALDEPTRGHLIDAMKATRVHQPPFNNWLLFSAMVEAFLCFAGEAWDPMRVDYALRQHEQWYKGDGTYGDGPDFHWDYYNSFVIQPMLLEITRVLGAKRPQWEAMREPVRRRARKYAAVLEQLISPEGTFPAFGRSLAYRAGALQLLSQVALGKMLPEGISPAQVRCALTAVMKRQMEAPGTWDENGWLRIGFCGHQPSIAESYISTGSLYLCSIALLPLGLPPEDEFWSAPPAPWSSKRIWSGEDAPPARFQV